MVIYIREEAAKFAREQATFAKPAADTVVKSELHAFKLETVVSGLEVVWGVEFLPDGRLLLTEKPGRLRIVENGQAAARRRLAECPPCGRRDRAACSTWPCIPTTRPTAGSTSRTAIRVPTTPR